MDADDPSRTAAALVRSSLVKRLVDNHGFDEFEAFTAVAAVEAGSHTPHAQLVTEEAANLYRDMHDRISHMFIVQFRTMLQAFERLGPVISDIAHTFARYRTHPNSAVGQWVRERPAWVSPYGPRTRRRSR
jgi:hypothetical protein